MKGGDYYERYKEM